MTWRKKNEVIVYSSPPFDSVDARNALEFVSALKEHGWNVIMKYDNVTLQPPAGKYWSLNIVREQAGLEFGGTKTEIVIEDHSGDFIANLKYKATSKTQASRDVCALSSTVAILQSFGRE